MARPRVYSDQQRTDALAQLLLNNGNVKATALQLGIPSPNLIRWREEQAAVSESADTETKLDLIGRWRATMLKALERANQLVAGETDLKAVSVLAGIAADKYLDFAEGRKKDTPAAVAAAAITVNLNYADPDDDRHHPPAPAPGPAARYLPGEALERR